MRAAAIADIHPLFKHMNPDSLKILLKNCNMVRIPKARMLLYKQGEPAYERIYIVIAGRLGLLGQGGGTKEE